MAQLSEDSFARGEPIRSLEDAVAAILARLSAVDGVDVVSLDRADGRVLARDLVATMQVPPFTNSAVDGYAVRGDDVPTDAPGSFAVVGRLHAGTSESVVVAPGEAVRVFTGAPLPAGADTVFMQEDVRIDEAGQAHLPPGLKRGSNARPAGEDIALGSVVLSAGRWLQPQDVAVVAALGLTEIEVRRRVKVAVLSTGDEIVEPGVARKAAQLFDSNRFMLLAMLRRLGCEVTDLGAPTGLTSQIAEAVREAALSRSSGSEASRWAKAIMSRRPSSVGKLVFWRIAIKPGRPVAMGVVEGTPLSAFPTLKLRDSRVARPAILALAGARWVPPPVVAVRATFSYRKKPKRREYVRVHLRAAADGELEATKFPREGAGLLSSLVDTDGFAVLPETVTRVEPGQWMDFLSYASLL
jgi:molybdopterin molybdotransferase